MIGVFGGTFDPIHFGHLRPVLEVSELLGLDQVRLIPCGLPPHRDGPAATTEQRLAMVELALRGVPDFVLDEREIRREGPSYMVDTLESLRQEFMDEPLCLILGMDSFSTLPGWHQWQRLIKLAHLVVMTRPGWEMPVHGDLGQLIEESQTEGTDALLERPFGSTFFCDVTALEISSTGIRDSLRDARSIRFLLPEVVREYLEEFLIYR